jgi:hypothetical protein
MELRIILIPKYRQFVVDNGKVNNEPVPCYGLIPAILAGIHVFLILCFSGSKKHLDFVRKEIFDFTDRFSHF